MKLYIKSYFKESARTRARTHVRYIIYIYISRYHKNRKFFYV